MFSHVSFCHSIQVGSHVTITHDPFDLCVQPSPMALTLASPWTWHLTVEGTPLWTWTSLYRDRLLVTSGGHHWRSVQTYSFQDPTCSGADIWWLLMYVQLSQAGSTMHPTVMLSCYRPSCLLPGRHPPGQTPPWQANTPPAGRQPPSRQIPCLGWPLQWMVCILLECILVTGHNKVVAKVIFLHLSVILFTGEHAWQRGACMVKGWGV